MIVNENGVCPYYETELKLGELTFGIDEEVFIPPAATELAANAVLATVALTAPIPAA